MSKEIKDVTGQAKPRDPISRIAELEQQVADLQQWIVRLRGAVVGFTEMFSETRDNLEAFAAILGEEKVAATKQLLRVQELRNQLAARLSEGAVRAVDTITETALVVGHEERDGQTLEPGYLQVPVTRLDDEVRAVLVGKGIGAIYEANGTRFVVDEIYDLPAQEVTQEPEKA